MTKRFSLDELVWFTIVSLGIVYSAMHLNFLEPYSRPQELLDFQLSLAAGSHPDNYDQQSRILFPFLLKMVYLLFKRPYWTVFSAEALSAIFSLFGVFLLAKAVITDKKYALLSVILFFIFAPYALIIRGRFGELFIPGFYCLLLFFILKEKLVWYVFCLIIASFQRPDVAIGSVFVKIAHQMFIKKKYKPLIFDIFLFLIPFAVFYLIKEYFGIKTSHYIDNYIANITAWPMVNLRSTRYIILMYFPAIVLGVLLFRYFNQAMKLIFLASLPYLALITVFGAYLESRLLLPIFAVLIIGIVSVLKEMKLLEFPDLKHFP